MTLPPELNLRRALAADAYPLWLWANDAETRRASFGRGPISWSTHVAWLDERLADPDTAIFVGESGGGRPVGSVRFDTADGWATARLSFVVAPEARGAGFARPLVLSGVAQLRREHAGVEVYAEVLDENPRSLAVFQNLGWTPSKSNVGLHRFVLKG